MTVRRPRHPARLLAWAALAAPLVGSVWLVPGKAVANGHSCTAGETPWSMPDQVSCLDAGVSVAGALGRDEALGAQPFNNARILAAAGELDAALTVLGRTEVAFPRLSDRVALLRAELLIEAGRYEEALDALAKARSSVDSAIRVDAEVAEVRVRILRDDPRAEGLLRALCGRYQELSSEPELRLLLGESLLRRDRRTQAAEIFRKLDLHFPGSAPSLSGMVHLEQLRADGVRVRRLLNTERVDRAERLVSQGHHDLARAELAALGEARLSFALRSRVHLATADLARLEGRWREAFEHQRLGIRRSPPVPAEEAEARAERAADLMTATVSRDVALATQRIAHMLGRREYSQLASSQLVQIIGVGARAGLAEPVRAATHVLAERDIAADARMDAALEAMGLADDADLLRMFEPLANTRSQRGTQAAYYRARSLERLGRVDEARTGYRDVKVHDATPQRYYAMWSDVQLTAMRTAEQTDAHRLNPAATTRAEGMRPIAPTSSHESMQLRIDMNALAERLAPLAQEHGHAFPSLPRAHDLLRLGEADTAGHELYEAFLQWRDASGRPIRRVGLEGVARGGDRRRTGVSFAMRRERMSLAPEARVELAEISGSLGDHGIAVGLVGWEQVGPRPRAHAHLVEAAALRHGLDPNLLFAIMRVESVYQRGIISYAGAIGLTQIMPRTGRLIAQARGMENFDTGDLVDPALNLDFAAWYLASLIERFDGHLPLAIASYNGGPHNVRRWLRLHGPAQPVDAFLEFIPFEQTHRYVRRVLTHYQAYRAQVNLPPETLSMALPSGDDHAIAF